MLAFSVFLWLLFSVSANSRNAAKASSLPQSGCTNFEWITDADRSNNYQSKANFKCDRNVFQKNTGTWFRFGGSAGSSMPTSPPLRHRCGSRSPGWVKGAHPTKINQQKSVTVCFLWHQGKPCYWRQKIKVMKCNGFFVYQLKPVPTCYLRYCGNGKKEQLLQNSSTIRPTLLASPTTPTTTVANNNFKGVPNCLPSTMTTFSVKRSRDVTVKLNPFTRLKEITTPKVTVQSSKKNKVSVKILSIIAAVLAVLVVLFIAIFACFIVRAIKKKRCDNALRSKRSEKNEEKENVLDATVEYACPSMDGYLVPADGRKESFYQGLRATKESFYQPLKQTRNQNAPMTKPVSGYIDKRDLATHPKHATLEIGIGKASSPLRTEGEILRHSQIEERDYNEIDQCSFTRNIFKKKSNRSLSTENRNSLYSHIEENGSLSSDTKEKEELFTSTSTDHNMKNSNRNSGNSKKSNRSLSTENRNSLYSHIEENGTLRSDTKEKEELFVSTSTDHNIKNSNRNSGNSKSNLHNTNPTYMALGNALSKTNINGEYCYPPDPMYHILDGQDPNGATSPHLYTVLEGPQ